MKEKWSTTCYKGMGLVKVILMRRFYDNDLPTVMHDSILICAPNAQMILKWIFKAQSLVHPMLYDDLPVSEFQDAFGELGKSYSMFDFEQKS